jgi:predicted transcriptional regulator
MAIIKVPPKQPKSVTIQARVEEFVKTQLDQYAKFIDSTPPYVITEALKVLFKRDDEFKAWLGQQPSNGKARHIVVFARNSFEGCTGSAWTLTYGDNFGGLYTRQRECPKRRSEPA